MATSGTASEKRYARLIAHARSREAVEGYGEKHHVIPRSQGGGNEATNLVLLTAREHFLAHWLLYRIYRTPAMARAFKLMLQTQGRRRGRDYAEAREVMSRSMRGDNNVARRPEVRQKLRDNVHSPFAGKKRPEQASLMRSRGVFVGANNPGHGMGARQQGVLNHRARKVVGVHPYAGPCRWDTLTHAACDLGVSVQAVSQSIRLKGRTKGWRMELVK